MIAIDFDVSRRAEQYLRSKEPGIMAISIGKYSIVTDHGVIADFVMYPLGTCQRL